MSESTYCLTQWALGRQPELPIDENRFVALRTATRAEQFFLSLEEKLDLVLANYREFEQELLSLALRHSIHRDLDTPAMWSSRLVVVRRLANLLTTARVYVDHVTRELNLAVAGNPGLKDVSASEYLAREYDRSLGFRVMEAIRNHVQHRSIPVETLTYHAQLDEGERGSLFLFSVSVDLNMKALREDGEFKKAVLEELTQLPEKEVDLVLFVRQHIEGIGRAHESMRQAIAQSVSDADLIIDTAVGEWNAMGGPGDFLAAVMRGPDRCAIEHFYVSSWTKERRIELATANRGLDKLSRRYVSSERPRGNYPPLTPPSPAQGTDC